MPTITFVTEIPDSALSSSSNGRGLLYHDQPGYAVNDYDEGPHYSHGHDYHLYDHHPDVHGPPNFEHDEHHSFPHSGHHDFHDPHGHRDYLPSHGSHYPGHKGHHSDHGTFNKHYKHALAAKTVLWPIAGLALLGAAAALVSNPVLLQLGVVSGKRRRRDTEEVTGPDFPLDTFSKYEDKIKDQSDGNKMVQLKENLKKKTKQNRILKIASFTETSKKRLFKTDNHKDVSSYAGIRKIRSSVIKNSNQVTTSPPNYNSNNDDDRFIPIPIKLRTSIVSE
ncbi:hypothetical protein PYW07_012204 [Mythimna separata]|uniref:Uncharacterized protein n=1 Tax=Mythimna separata TaxID=271217 RepID=A0AAD7YL82_MYTSE|nr:hypothetical protein PYW07_012204 [Mythimna separata]